MHIHEEIAKVAYELYEKGSRIDGRDVENWLEAEKIVKARHAGKDLASPALKMKQAGEVTAQKVKETANSLKTAVRKI